MPKFEVNFLEAYTDESLLDEIRRVADQYPGPSLSKVAFDRLSGRVSASTISRRFSGWHEALRKAGREHLYGGHIVSKKMKEQPARRLTREDLIAELKRVQAILGTESISREQFNEYSITSYAAIHNRFGWTEALKIAGINPTPGSNRWTDQECLENLAAVWTHYGRPPTYREMFKPPSTVRGKAYGRWGTWRKALRTFAEWANGENDGATSEPLPEQMAQTMVEERHVSVQRTEEDRREVGPRLRFRVLQRDRFRCLTCGRSPANDLEIILHADHIKPVALGGKTVIENLQTLCEKCNLGKGKFPSLPL